MTTEVGPPVAHFAQRRLAGNPVAEHGMPMAF